MFMQPERLSERGAMSACDSPHCRITKEAAERSRNDFATRERVTGRLYISDFGEHRVVPNRFSRNRTALILDMDYWAVSYLRKVSQKEIARTGGAQKRYLDVEFGLVSRNEAASGKVSDLS